MSRTILHGGCLEVLLSEERGVTELRFVQHLDDATGVGSVGPGWE